MRNKTDKNNKKGDVRQRILPFFIPQEGCPGQCIYCNQRSITARENPPSVSDIDAVIAALPDDASYELAFYGGSFTALTAERQLEYLQTGLKWIKSGRLSGIRVSTRPDYIDDSILFRLREHGVVCVELGVQSMDKDVLSASGRDYDAACVRNAVRLIKEYDLKAGVQLMPGLPCDDYAKSMSAAWELVALKPDLARIYPTVVLADTPLADLYQAGSYTPLTLAAAINISCDMTAVFMASDIPVIRLGLNPSSSVENALIEGPYHPSFGGMVYSALAWEQAKTLLRESPNSKHLYAHPDYLSVLIGHGGENKKNLRENYGNIAVKSLDTLPEYALAVSDDLSKPPEKIIERSCFLLQYIEGLR